MLDTATQLLEKGGCTADIRISASDKPEQLAFLGGAGAPAYWTFDKRATLAGHRRSVRFHGLRAHRAHVDYELARKVALQDAVRATVDHLGGVIVQQHHDRDFATLYQFG